MNILVTGATGFVGRHLIPLLLQEGHQLICIVRDREKASCLFGEDGIFYVLSEQLENISVYKPECVIHLAAYLSSRDDEEVIYKLLESNIIFGTRLLSALKGSGHKIKLFINFGTCAEYRFGAMEVNNAYLYSATKTAFKQLLDYYAGASGYKYINIIPYTIYGGNDDSQKKIIDFIKDSFDAIDAIQMSEGKQVLDFIHVDDVVSFVCFVLNNISLFINQSSTDYHLGTGIGTSIRDLVYIVENKYQKKCNIHWGALPYRSRDVMYAVAPIGRLIDMGWYPKIKLEDGL